MKYAIIADLYGRAFVEAENRDEALVKGRNLDFEDFEVIDNIYDVFVECEVEEDV